MKPPIPVLGAALALALLAFQATAQDTTRYQAIAVDERTGKPLYRESHVEVASGGPSRLLRTRFLRLDGEVFAERTLESSPGSFAPAYRFEDFRTGWQEGARAEGEGFRVYCRKGEGRPRKEKRLRVPAPAVIDAGFNDFLRRHQEALARGERLDFQIVVPSRLAWYRFEAHEDMERGGKGPGARRVFVAVPRNRALRLVAPRIEVTYDPATRRMTGYQGISNLRADDGSNQYIRLTYSGGGP